MCHLDFVILYPLQAMFLYILLVAYLQNQVRWGQGGYPMLNTCQDPRCFLKMFSKTCAKLQHTAENTTQIYYMKGDAQFATGSEGRRVG